MLTLASLFFTITAICFLALLFVNDLSTDPSKANLYKLVTRVAASSMFLCAWCIGTVYYLHGSAAFKSRKTTTLEQFQACQNVGGEWQQIDQDQWACTSNLLEAPQ